MLLNLKKILGANPVMQAYIILGHDQAKISHLHHRGFFFQNYIKGLSFYEILARTIFKGGLYLLGETWYFLVHKL